MRDHEFLASEWDVCVVLDACRYDVFSRVYDEYLSGTLEKRWSRGSSTPEWAARTFTGEHDLAYFSGNPFINDLGVPLADLQWGASCDYQWTANRHIRHVVDVWDDGWDDDLGTVPPASLEAAYRDNRDLVDSTERTVLHYMQPHAPYLSRGSGQKLTQIQQGIRKQARADGAAAGGVLGTLGDRLRPTLEATLEGWSFAQKVGLWLELGPVALARQGTREAAMALHEENLRIALTAVADLLPDLAGRVVVTADHGEAFGEDGVWEHHVETHIPPLMEVPWLVIE